MNKSPFIITRTLAAPRHLVWKAWTESERLAHWWGPKGCKVRVAALDLRPGGTFHYAMDWPAGGTMWGLFSFREISPQDRLVYLNSFSNEQGEVAPAPFPDPWPLRMLTTVSFTEDAGMTTVAIHWEPFEASEAEWMTFDKGRDSMTQGWTGTFEQLEAYLAGER